MLVNANQTESSTQRRKSSTLQSQTARLLILGDRQVGKSASIVKYTTGRFIQDYAPATTDWLYRRPLDQQQAECQNPQGSVSQRRATSVELLEQRDVQFVSSSNFFAPSANLLEQQQAYQQQSKQGPQTALSLANRVALDQQIDNELHEKQNLFNKLHWAHAYIVIYAINDVSTFNKAIKYLNLIANNINSPLDNNQRLAQTETNSIPANGSATGAAANKLAPNNQTGSVFSLNNQQTGNRRPILLLANKSDLERAGRQVSVRDGRLLAMRHLSMFAEVSIAGLGARQLEGIFNNLVDSIEPGCLDRFTASQGDHEPQSLEKFSPISKWNSKWSYCQRPEAGALCVSPVLASIVKSQPIVVGGGFAVARSSKLAAGSRNHEKAPLISLAQSVETKSLRKPMTVGCVRETSRGLDLQPDLQHQQQQHQQNGPGAHPNRYENFKSSFKRASMAIVGGKTLARAAKRKLAEKEAEKRNSLSGSGSASQRSSFDSCDMKSGGWIKRLSRELGSRENNSVDSDSFRQADSSSLSSESGGKFRRPLFRYKSRRSTVGLEEIRKLGSQPEVELESETGSLKGGFNSGSRSGSDSSCLSTTTATAESQRQSVNLPTPIGGTATGSGGRAAGRAPSSVGSMSVCSSVYSSQSPTSSCETAPAAGTKRPVSQSNLSRTSTSGGSHDDSADESPAAAAALTAHQLAENIYQRRGCSLQTDCNRISDSINDRNKNIKRRYQLVKSVQSTLTNLTKSSNTTAQAAKKSFCNTLFKYSSGPSATALAVKAPLVTPLVASSCEQTIRVPAVVGYCK